MDNITEFMKDVGSEVGLSTVDVEKCYRAFWKTIYNNITAIDLTQDNILSEDEFNTLNLNFNIPSLGKISCTYKRYLNLKNWYKNVKNKKGTSSDGRSVCDTR